MQPSLLSFSAKLLEHSPHAASVPHFPLTLHPREFYSYVHPYLPKHWHRSPKRPPNDTSQSSLWTSLLHLILLAIYLLPVSLQVFPSYSLSPNIFSHASAGSSLPAFWLTAFQPLQAILSSLIDPIVLTLLVYYHLQTYLFHLGLFLKLQTWISNCRLNLATGISKIYMAKIYFIIFHHPKPVQMRPVSIQPSKPESWN